MKVKLRDVSNIIMGQSPDSSTYNTENIGLPFFQGNADFGELNPIAKTWCSSPIKIAYKNYILISVRAPIGALNIAAETCCIGRGLAALDVNNKMCTEKYLWYLLKAKKNELLSKGTGSTFKAISKNILSEMEFNIPPVREQELCTKTLDVVFGLIRLKKEQLDKLDLLVKSRFIEMFGESNYPLVKACDVCDFITKGTTPNTKEIYENYTDERIPFLKVYNLSNTGKLLFKNKTQYIDNSVHNGELSRSIVFPNDVLMNIVGPPLGKFAIVDDSFPEWNVNQAIAIFRAKREILPLYLLYSLMQDDILSPFLQKAVGVRQLNISLEQCRELQFRLPPLNLQHNFSVFAQQVDKSKLAIQQSLDELETLKKSLMQQYFG